MEMEEPTHTPKINDLPLPGPETPLEDVPIEIENLATEVTIWHLLTHTR